jgi:hypothetical protein
MLQQKVENVVRPLELVTDASEHFLKNLITRAEYEILVKSVSIEFKNLEYRMRDSVYAVR